MRHEEEQGNKEKMGLKTRGEVTQAENSEGEREIKREIIRERRRGRRSSLGREREALGGGEEDKQDDNVNVYFPCQKTSLN